MKTYFFDTFNEARDFARFLSIDFKILVKITPSEGKFRTWHEEQITLEKYQYFFKYGIRWGDREEKIRFLDFLDTSYFCAPSLVWSDIESGLVWDTSRLLSGIHNTEIPENQSAIMNAVFYGGRKGWRLPTIAELETLNSLKLANSNIQHYQSKNGEARFWASDRSLYDRDEKAFFDVLTRQRGDQRYKESHPDKQSYGDGYIESAQTMLVSSGEPS